MNNLMAVTDKVIALAENSYGRDPRSAISEQIAYYLNDALRMVKNIQDTSLNPYDKRTRFEELERTFGVAFRDFK